eukprot:5191-Heterococcus_DN1.PRE.2
MSFEKGSCLHPNKHAAIAPICLQPAHRTRLSALSCQLATVRSHSDKHTRSYCKCDSSIMLFDDMTHQYMMLRHTALP